MKALESYIFRQVAYPLIAILTGLSIVAILTQGLNQLDIIVEQRQSALAFFWVTLLSLPQLIALILPLAVFFAVIYALNRMHTENEIVVSFGAGVSPWQIVGPVLKLAALGAVVHLAVNVIVQPASYREMRATMHAIRNDLASSLIREGDFSTPADGLTFYARTVGGGGVMKDLFIDDSRNEGRPTTYTAASGNLVMTGGNPAIVMRQGQIQQPKADGSVDLLDFDQYTFELGAFAGQEDYILKPSDRYLSELFFPDLTYFYDQRNVDRLLAEGHHRLSGPLLNFTLALVACAGLIAGDFSRRGYGVRIAWAAGIAVMIRILSLGIEAACVDEPSLNPVQYLFPLMAGGFAILMLLGGKLRLRRRRRAPPQQPAMAMG